MGVILLLRWELSLGSVITALLITLLCRWLMPELARWFVSPIYRGELKWKLYLNFRFGHMHVRSRSLQRWLKLVKRWPFYMLYGYISKVLHLLRERELVMIEADTVYHLKHLIAYCEGLNSLSQVAWQAADFYKFHSENSRNLYKELQMADPILATWLTPSRMSLFLQPGVRDELCKLLEQAIERKKVSPDGQLNNG